jgi:DNA-binding SARP family transcriptional activator
MMRYRILGRLEIDNDGEPAELTGQRERKLLIDLLLHANHVVPTDRLVDDLWGESPPKNATASLHNALGKLRGIAGDRLVRQAPGYVLQVDREQVDALRFEDLLASARDAEPAARAAALREALALFRGPPLLDVAYESFAAQSATRLEELRLVAREDLAEAELELGATDALVPELEALVAEHPLRERLWGLLMLALYRAGRQADALQAYQDARRALVSELGLEPGPQLRELHGAIIRQEADLVPARPSGRRGASTDLGDVVTALLAGRVVPVLGEDSASFAASLAARFRYPRSEAPELPRVSQYAAALQGYGPLYDELRALVTADDPPTAVHTFFASLPPLLRERGVPHQLLVTTSYGTALERAFRAAGEEIDVVSYIASGRSRGSFRHTTPDGTSRIIDVPNTYATELSLDRRTVILKMRGQADPSEDTTRDSFVVTEDDYIDYLGRADMASGVPVALAAALRRSHFLFLGYTVRDWHLRLVLGRMWGDEPVAYRSWAVHPSPGPAEHELWRRLDVDLTETSFDVYIQALADAVGAPREQVA